MKLAQKIAAITAEFGELGVPKAGFNKDQSYPFRRFDDLVGVANKLLAKHGVAFVPNRITVVENNAYERERGRLFKVTIIIEYLVQSAETDEKWTVSAIGCGTDTLDKATAKAMTMAYKSAIGQTFHVPFTGLDAEEDGGTELLEMARKVAAKGREKFVDFWKTLTPDERNALRPFASEFEQLVNKADQK